MQNKTKLIFIISAIIIIIATLFLTDTIKINNKETLPDGNNIVASTTTEKTVGGVTYSGTGDFKIEQILVNENPLVKVPDLNRPLNFPVDMSPEVRAIIAGKISKNIDNLKSKPDFFDEWISLGINRKMINDYEGAKEAWEYGAILSPKSAVVFSNLGDLYGYYLKDNAKAEKDFLKAIDNDSAFPNYYLRAADFYREVLGDFSKAKAILIKGLSVIQDESNLKRALEQVNDLIANKSNSSNQ